MEAEGVDAAEEAEVALLEVEVDSAEEPLVEAAAVDEASHQEVEASHQEVEASHQEVEAELVEEVLEVEAEVGDNKQNKLHLYGVSTLRSAEEAHERNLCHLLKCFTPCNIDCIFRTMCKNCLP